MKKLYQVWQICMEWGCPRTAACDKCDKCSRHCSCKKGK
jgi:hypothetical protein